MAVVEKLQAFFVELTSAKSSIVIRPATKSPILISMNTIGLGSFRNILLLSMVANSPACRRFSARRKNEGSLFVCLNVSLKSHSEETKGAYQLGLYPRICKNSIRKIEFLDYPIRERSAVLGYISWSRGDTEMIC